MRLTIGSGRRHPCIGKFGKSSHEFNVSSASRYKDLTTPSLVNQRNHSPTAHRKVYSVAGPTVPERGCSGYGR